MVCWFVGLLVVCGVVGVLKSKEMIGVRTLDFFFCFGIFNCFHVAKIDTQAQAYFRMIFKQSVRTHAPTRHWHTKMAHSKFWKKKNDWKMAGCYSSQVENVLIFESFLRNSFFSWKNIALWHWRTHIVEEINTDLRWPLAFVESSHLQRNVANMEPKDVARKIISKQSICWVSV